MAAKHWTADPRVRRVLREGRRLFLGVAVADGPHVTAVAFADVGDRLWTVVPRNSAKVRALRLDDRIGGLVRGRRHDLLVGGTATILDPARGLSAASLLELPFAAAGYLARNDRDAVGVLRANPSPSLPLTRVAVRLDLDRVALVCDGRLLASWGNWPRRSVLLAGHGTPAVPDARGLPATAARRLRRDDAAAVIGWLGPTGPNVLPAHWFADGWAQADPATLELCGALPAGRASLTLESSRSSLDSKRGVLLVGPGRIRRDGDTAHLAIDARRITWWRGAEAGTVRP
jgi:hypothetical protein